MTHLSDKLMDRLAQLGMSRYELAKRMGLTPSAVLHISSGRRRPTDELLRKIAEVEVLELTYVQLLAWRALDDYGPEALALAFQELHPELQTLTSKAKGGQPTPF